MSLIKKYILVELVAKNILDDKGLILNMVTRSEKEFNSIEEGEKYIEDNLESLEFSNLALIPTYTLGIFIPNLDETKQTES